MIILQDSQIKKIFHNGDEVKKILDWDGNVIFYKKSGGGGMTNTIKFHTKSSFTDSARFMVTYTDSTSDEMRYSEPNKQYVFQIPTDKIVKKIAFSNVFVDEVIVSCKVKLSNDLFTENPKTVRLLSCDATSNKSLSNALRNMAFDSTLVEIINLDARNATSAYELFGTNVESFVLKDLNLSKVKDMSYMFSGCSATTIDIANWDTSSVNNLNRTFAYCTKVTSLDLSSWDTSNVTNMSYMFSYCTSLASLDVSHFNTNNVTNMGYMFGSCEKLASLDVSHFNTNNVTNMGGMFSRCPKLASLDLSGWNTAKVTDMSSMFMLCQAKSLDLSGWDMTSVETTNNMFFRCNSLKTIRMIGCNQTTIDKIKAQLKSDGILNNVTIVTE